MHLVSFLYGSLIGNKSLSVWAEYLFYQDWNNDRGKDVESVTWYHIFDGDRINDYHLKLAEKWAAREKENQT